MSRLRDFAERHARLLASAITLVLIAVAMIASGAVYQRCAPAVNVSRFSATTAANLVKLRTDLSVTMVTASTSLTVPTGGSAGGDIRSWARADGAVGGQVIVKITGSTSSTLTGPVGLYGGSVADGQEYLLGTLNGGSDIKLGGSTTGYAEAVAYVGVFDYLTIGGVGSTTITPSNSAAVTAKAVPLQN